MKHFQILMNDDRVGVVYRYADSPDLIMERWDWKKKAWVEAYDSLGRALVMGDTGLETIDEAQAKKAIKSRDE